MVHVCNESSGDSLVRHPGVAGAGAGAGAGAVKVEVEGILTVDTAREGVTSLTLIRILNKEALKPFINRASRQIEMQFLAE
jgi:hypothetical protein